jgi:hypothetical protein
MNPEDAEKTKKDQRRAARLAASLRENLKRRKMQQRSRSAMALEEKKAPPSRDPKG